MEMSYHTLAFGVTEQELISAELQIVIPGCEVYEVREVSEGRWEADIRRIGANHHQTTCVSTSVLDDTPLGISVDGHRARVDLGTVC